MIAIIAVLSAMLFPVLTTEKQSAHKTQCSSNLKQIVTAWQIYADDNFGRACPSYYFDDNGYEHAWDFIFISLTSAVPGFLGPYMRCGAIQQCPSFRTRIPTSGSASSGTPPTDDRSRVTPITQATSAGIYATTLRCLPPRAFLVR